MFALGDPTLGTETTWGLAGTLQVEAEWVKASWSGYVNYIDDYIYFSPDLGPAGVVNFETLVRGVFPRFRHAAVDALFYGGEGQVTFHAGPVDLGGQVSVVRARALEGPRYLTFIPPDRFQIEATYHLQDQGIFSNNYFTIDGSYVARQSRFEARADLAHPPNDFFLLGISAGTQFSWGDYEFWASVEADNLFNTRYREYTSLLRYFADEPGRQVYLRLGAQLEI